MNPLLKGAMMTYGAYKGTSLLFGDSTLRNTPGDITTTVGNVAIGGIAIGSSLNYLKKVSPTTYNSLRTGFNKMIEPGKYAMYTSTSGAYGVPYKTTVSKFEYITSKLGMKTEQFANKGFIRSSLEILENQSGKFGNKLEAIGALAIERGGPAAKSSLEFLMSKAPKTPLGFAAAVGTAYIGSRVLGSVFDSIFGGRRR